MVRRQSAILAAALSLLAAAPALAANKVVTAQRFFHYYDSYLALPAAERSQFTLNYYLHQGGRPVTAPVWLVEGDRKSPIPLRADGKVLRLPTPAQLAGAKVEIGLDESVKLGLQIGLEPTVAPARDLDANALALAIVQGGAGIKKMAGVLALALPKVDSVAFAGAGEGEIEFADGHRAPLPVVKGAPTYTPAAQPGARRIHLARPPIKIDID